MYALKVYFDMQMMDKRQEVMDKREMMDKRQEMVLLWSQVITMQWVLVSFILTFFDF